MSEFKRLYCRNILLLLAALIIINIGLFILSCSPEKAITLTGEELEAYIDEYPEFLENVKQSGQNMLLLNMYKKGFSADNITKSAAAYAKLGNIKAEYGDNRGVILLFNYELTDILLLAFLLIMTMRFLTERKKGLVNLIRVTKKGRYILYFQRVFILAVSAVFAGILLYSGNLIGMLCTFGKGGMTRAIQSLPEFKQCPYAITIGEYFVLSCFLKILACFFAALAFFTLISVFGTAVSYIITLLITVAELLLFTLIPSVSSLNFLKYINIFAVIKCGSFMSVCRNINIFGNAFSALLCNIVFLLAMIVLLFLSGCFIHGKMYVRRSNLFEAISSKISRIIEKLSFQKTLFGWENYKLIVKQGGMFFMAGAFLLTLNSALKYDYSYPINVFEKAYYEQFHGEITEAALGDAENELLELEETVEHYQNAIDELLAKGEEYLSSVTEQRRLGRLQASLEEAQQKKEAFMSVIENIRDGFDYTQRTGNSVQLIEPYAYDLLLNGDKQSAHQASLFILIGIIGAVSGVFAYDRQNNMKNTLLSSYRGRTVLTLTKICAVFIFCTFICVSSHIIQLVQVGKFLGYNDMNAPVQSLMFMRGFTPYVKIYQYLIMLFLLRAAASFAIGIICMAVSRFSADTTTAMGISIFVLAVPSVFAEIIAGENSVNLVYILSGDYFK
ncbi:MAG: hypothetical protein NC320_13455 [Clostridium sp.]|nr:hypothetical protein [Clostridium sp.]MCM1547099.1 hypothetical protein [Ruminococcus sp.]